jgi:hypothetical protein
MEPRAYGRERREYTFVGMTKASPEAVFDVLADLNTHMQWAGRRQWKMFRLLSLEAPPGLAQAGTMFESVGKIPMMSTRWLNRNTVTKADRPPVFEMTTEGRIPWRRRPHGRHLHQPVRDCSRRDGLSCHVSLASIAVPGAALGASLSSPAEHHRADMGSHLVRAGVPKSAADGRGALKGRGHRPSNKRAG